MSYNLLMKHQNLAGRALVRCKRWSVGIWLVVVILLLCGSLGKIHLIPEAARTGGPGVAARGSKWYFRTGQWRADAESLLAAARWCLTPESALPPTNGTAAAALPNTNSTAGLPTV
jgi:hypothetical protein